MAVSIFFCYAHEDEPFLKKLKAHLRPLQRQGLIDVWHDRDISAGTEWEQEIKKHLNEAKIILLLVSSDFMDSEYCYSIEMKRALERHQRGEARVIPIILRPVYWQGILGNIQALPIDAKPVKSWSDLDEAFFNVTEGIRNIVEEQARKVEEACKAEEVKISRAKTERVIIALENPNYDWRTIDGVSEETQLSPEEVQKIISELGGQVINSRVPDVQGRPLYTTKAHYNRRK